MNESSFTEQMLRDKGFVPDGKGGWQPSPTKKQHSPPAALKATDVSSAVERMKAEPVPVDKEKLLKKAKKKPKINIYILSIKDELHRQGVKFQEKELMFHTTRKWRFDIALEPVNGVKVAIEFNGGQFSSMHGKKSRHTNPLGYAGDLDKINAAQMMGWIVLQFTTSHFGKEGIGAYGIVQLAKQALNIN